MSKTIENQGFIVMEVPFFQVANDIFKVKIKNDKGKFEPLGIYEKMTYIYLARCANQSTAFPSYQTIADNCSMSRRKAINCVEVLFKHNLIRKTKRKKTNNNNDSNIYEINTNLNPYISTIIEEKKETSAQHAPGGVVHSMHHPSAHGAPYKELYINNYLKTEEEEAEKKLELSTGKKPKPSCRLSKKIHDKFYAIFKRKLSNSLEKKIIAIYKDESIINLCLDLAETNATYSKYIIVTLENWKKHGFKTIKEVKEYLELIELEKETKTKQKKWSMKNKEKNKKVKDNIIEKIDEDEIAELYYQKGYR